MSQPDFWLALASLGDGRYPTGVWARAAGADFPTLRAFLAVCPDAEPPELVPCPSCSAWLRVTHYGDGTFAVDHAEDTGCQGPSEPLPEAALDVLALDRAAFVRAIAVALDITPFLPSLAVPLSVLQIGSIPVAATRRNVFLSVCRSSRDHELAAGEIQRTETGPFVLLTPSHQPDLARRVHPMGEVLCLSDLCTPAAGARFSRIHSLEHARRALAGAVALAPLRAIPPLRGKRFELADDYSAVTQLRPKKVWQIDNERTRQALKVLHTGAAVDERSAMPKRTFVAGVLALDPLGTPRPKNPQPHDFFRRRVGDRVVVFPFYDSLIGRSGRSGKYWLNL